MSDAIHHVEYKEEPGDSIFADSVFAFVDAVTLADVAMD
jgi:hypothetical protein